MATFSGFFKQPNSETVYGIADQGRRVAFQTGAQLAQAQGLATPDFSQVQTDSSFNPSGSILYPDYQKLLTATPSQNSIPLNQLTSPPTQVNLTGTVSQPDASKANGTVGGAKQQSKSIAEYIKEATPPMTPEREKLNTYLSEYESLIGQQGQRSADTAAEEERVGLPLKQQAVTNAQGELDIRIAEWEREFQEIEGKSIVNSSITGQQAQAKKLAAADISVIQAKLSAAQGNLQLSQQQVDRAINLKYDTIESELATKRAQISAIDSILDDQERAFALALDRKYQDEEDAIAEEKARTKNNINFAIEAGITSRYYNYFGEVRDASTGEEFDLPDSFFAASGVSSFEEAYQRKILTDYQPEEELDTQIVNGKLINAQTGAIIADYSKSSSGGGSSKSKKAADEDEIKFTSTQTAKGAASAGLSIAQFKELSPDEQNDYINGQYKDLEKGRLPAKDFAARKKVIDEALSQRESIENLRAEIDASDIPRADKDALKEYVEDHARETQGWIAKIFKPLPKR